MIQTFSPHTAKEPLADGIGLGCSYRRPEHLYPPIFCRAIEILTVFTIVIPDQKAGLYFIGRCFPHLLRYPEVIRCPRHPILHDAA